MANYNTKAFDNMMESTKDDMYVTGGSIILSEYEHNMSPIDQNKYEEQLYEVFQNAYIRDPYRRNLDFKHWLKSLNTELYEGRADNYEEIISKNYGEFEIKGMGKTGELLEDAGIMQKLAHLHTGRIEDLIEIVESQIPLQTTNPGANMDNPDPSY